MRAECQRPVPHHSGTQPPPPPAPRRMQGVAGKEALAIFFYLAMKAHGLKGPAVGPRTPVSITGKSAHSSSPLSGCGEGLWSLELAFWGSFSALHVVGSCQVLPFSGKGTGTQPLGPQSSLLRWGLLLLRQDCFGRAAFRDYLLTTPGGAQGSPQSLTPKIIGKGPYFPAASQLRTCTEWNVFLRE